MQTPHVVAVVCSDLHLSHKPPPARSGEPDWYGAMERVLRELHHSCRKHRAPLIIAGDVFNHWNSPPKLISFAMDMFRRFVWGVYTIPGQHDLPFHNYNNMAESAYYTLCASGFIHNLLPTRANPLDGDIPINIDEKIGLCMWAFPWGCDLVPLPQARENIIHLAVVHKYIWTERRGYPGAPAHTHVSKLANSLIGYHAAVFGDNHKGFAMQLGGVSVLNCGGAMRFKSDEEKYKPGYGLLMSDGTLVRRHYSTQADIFSPTVTELEMTDLMPEFVAFAEKLATLKTRPTDFRGAVDIWLRENAISPAGRDVLLGVLEEVTAK